MNTEWLARKLRELAQHIAELQEVAHSHRLEHVTTGAVAASNFTVISFDSYTSRTLLTFTITVERTTSAIVVPDTVTTGNITNVTVATLPTSCRGAITYGQHLSSGPTGRAAAGSYISNTGEVRLNAINSGDDIIVGEQLSLGGVVILNP